jgi:hypothetical protein
MVSLNEALLVLSGWEDRPLRLIVQSPEVWFSSFCTLWRVKGEKATFWIGGRVEQDAVSFLLTGCLFDFGDVPEDAPDAALPVGGVVESGLIGTRGRDFKIAIMLLKSA